MKAIIIDPIGRAIRPHYFNNKISSGTDIERAGQILQSVAHYYGVLPNGDTIFITEKGRLAAAAVPGNPDSNVLLIFGKAAIIRFEDGEKIDSETGFRECVSSMVSCMSKVTDLRKKIKFYNPQTWKTSSYKYHPNSLHPGEEEGMLPFKIPVRRVKHQDKYMRCPAIYC